MIYHSMLTAHVTIQHIVNALLQVHFDEEQFEKHRKDNKRKLKPNAVPTIFAHRPAPAPFRVTGKRRAALKEIQVL